MKGQIKQWEELTDKITRQWIKQYFEIEEDEDITVDWVAEDVGGIFEFADMWFDFSNILDCYKYNISRESLFLWYDYCLSNEFVNISLANFILSPEKRKEQEEKYLSDLKQRVVDAEETFKKALENYENNKN